MDIYTDMLLDRWIMHGNCLVGYVYDCSYQPRGTRVITDIVRFIDPVNMYAETLDERYRLGTPGTAEEHSHPLVGRPKDSADKLPEIKKELFLL